MDPYISGKKHLKKELHFRLQGNHNINMKGANQIALYCDVCDMRVQGVITMRTHCAGMILSIQIN